jgi:hypothetical protein
LREGKDKSKYFVGVAVKARWAASFLARGTEEGMEPDDLLCSRNARPQKALVGRAQWKINQAPSLERNEQAWREHIYRLTRALEVIPVHPATSWEQEKREAEKIYRAGIERKVSQSGHPFAPGTRTMKQCSLG